MQPNQLAEPHDPKRYDFFLNPPTMPKPSKLPIVPGTSDPLIRKVLVMVGVGLLLIVVVIILISVIFGGKDNSANLVKIAQLQNELIRVSGEATPGAAQQTTKSLAINTQLSLMTSQQQLLSYLQKHGHKVTTKELALAKSIATDTQLTNAKAASNFDPIFTQVLQQQLQAYTAAIKQDFTGATNTSLRQLLNAEYMGGSLLLSQANSTLTAVQAQ